MSVTTFRVLLSTLLLFVLLGCKPKLPSYVMSESKMEDVLYDYHMAQGMASAATVGAGKTEDERRYQYQQAVFKKYGITQADFDTSMAYYCSDMDRLYRIYHKVAARLEKEADALGIAAGPKDIYADLTSFGDTANVWADRMLFLLKPNPVENLYAWQLTCDSTWFVGDDLMWRFASVFLHKGARTDVHADIIVTYSNDSIRAYSTRVNVNAQTEMRIPNPEGWLPRLVSGHLYMPVDKAKENYRIAVIHHPVLIRFHKPESEREQLLTDSLQNDSLSSDTLSVDTLLTDTLLPLVDHRMSPEEFKERQPVDRKINVVKKKPYVRTPGRRRNARSLRPGRQL